MDYYTSLIDRLKTENNPLCKSAADGLESQAKQIDQINAFRQRELDFYRFDRKRLSRRIALLENWMERLFDFAKLPDAKRERYVLTMMTGVPDTLMREGEVILNQKTPALEKGDD